MRTLSDPIITQKNATENRLIYMLDVEMKLTDQDIVLRISDVELTYGGNNYLQLMASLNNLNEELNEEALSTANINLTLYNQLDYQILVGSNLLTFKLSDLFLNYSEGAICNLYVAFCYLGTNTLIGDRLLILKGFVESPVVINDDTINFSVVDKSFKYNKNFGIVITSDFTPFVPERSLGLVIPRVYGVCDNVNLIPIRDGKTVVLKTSILKGNSITEIETEETLSSWSSTGKIVIDNEEFTYSGISGSKFTFAAAITVDETHLRGSTIIEKLTVYKYAIADSMGVTITNGFDTNFSATGVKSTSEFRIKTRDNGFISVTPNSTQDELIAGKYKIRTAVFNEKPTYKEYSKSPSILDIKQDDLVTEGTQTNCLDPSNAFDGQDFTTWATLNPTSTENVLEVKVLTDFGTAGEKSAETKGDITNADVEIKYFSEKLLTENSIISAQLKWMDGATERTANLGNLPKPAENNTLLFNPELVTNHINAHDYIPPGSTQIQSKPNLFSVWKWDFAQSKYIQDDNFQTDMYNAYDSDPDTYGWVWTENKEDPAAYVRFKFSKSGSTIIPIKIRIKALCFDLPSSISNPQVSECKFRISFIGTDGKTKGYAICNCYYGGAQIPDVPYKTLTINATLDELTGGYLRVISYTEHTWYNGTFFDTIRICDVYVEYDSGGGGSFSAYDLTISDAEFKIAMQSMIVTKTFDLTNVKDGSNVQFPYWNWEVWKNTKLKITYSAQDGEETLSKVYVSNVQFIVEYATFQILIAENMVCKVEGMKAYGTTDLIRHPAKIIRDLLLYNGVLSSEIDSTSYIAIFSYISIGLDFALLEMQELYEIIKQIDYHSKFKTAWMVDRFKFLPNNEYDANPSIAKEITVQDIGIGSIQIKKDNFTDIRNRFFIYYKRDFSEDDSEENYHGLIEVKNQDSITKIGERSEKIFLPFINTQADAQTIANYISNLYGGTITTTTVKTPLTSLELEKGDIIKVNYWIDESEVAKYMGYKITGKILNVNRILTEYNQIEFAVKVINIESAKITEFCFYYDEHNYIYFNIIYNSAKSMFELHKYFIISDVIVAEIFIPNIWVGQDLELRIKGILYESVSGLRAKGGDDPMGFTPAGAESARFYWVNQNGERIAEITSLGNLRIANKIKEFPDAIAFHWAYEHPCFYNHYYEIEDKWYHYWMAEIQSKPLFMIPAVYFPQDDNDRMILTWGNLIEKFTF